MDLREDPEYISLPQANNQLAYICQLLTMQLACYSQLQSGESWRPGVGEATCATRAKEKSKKVLLSKGV